MLNLDISNEASPHKVPAKIKLENEYQQTMEALSNGDFVVSSIHNRGIFPAVVEKMKNEGIGVGGFNEYVCYVIGDASDPRYLDSVVKLKGHERKGMPMALAHSPEYVIDCADLASIPDYMHPYFQDKDLLKNTFGSIAFLRFPMLPSEVEKWPEQVVSGVESGYPMIQNWIPSSLLEPLVLEMEKMQMVVGITSLNVHGQPEMINQTEAAKLAQQYLGGFLYDERYPNDLSKYTNDLGNHILPFGSYPVIEIGNHLEDGIALVRRGPIDERVFQHLLKRKGLSVNHNSAKFPKFPFPDEVINALEQENSPIRINQMILEYLRLIREDQ